MAESNKPTPQNKQEPEQTTGALLKEAASQAKQKFHDTLRSKRAWLLLAIMLFLLAGGTLVPVGRIPLLRNLVYAMGYTPEETARLSLFQALFSWNDHNKILRGEKPDPNAIDVFGNAEAAARVADKTKEGRSGLLNIGAINAQRRRQGQGVEQVIGASGNPVNSDREDNAGVNLRNSNAAVNTEANAGKIGDVYFGEDTSTIIRNQHDGYNSVNSLKKVAAPIAGVRSDGGQDWFLGQVDKAIRQDAQLGGIEDNLEARGLSAGLGNVEKVGKGKAQRDLYWAWLTGRAARRTPQVLLKKTLAAAGFDGAELPKSVFTSVGFSGIGVNPDDVVADVGSIKKYLETDEKCKAALAETSSAAYTQKIDKMRSTINNISIPENCAGSAVGAQQFSAALNGIKSTCNEVTTVYNGMRENCGALNVVTQGKCDEVGFANQAEQFNGWCNAKLNECETASDPADCREKVNGEKWDTFAQEDNLRWSRDALKQEINKKYYKDGDPEKGLNDGYFPSANWGQSLWVDTSILD